MSLSSFNKKGFISNSLGVVSLLAFSVTVFSFVAIEFALNQPKKESLNTLQNALVNRELESFPVAPGEGTAYFKIVSPTNVYLQKELSVDVNLINNTGNAITGITLAIFIPNSFELLEKPLKTLYLQTSVNNIDYVTTAEGTQINIAVLGTLPLGFAPENTSKLLNLQLKPIKTGVSKITFIKTENYPEIADINQKSVLDLTTLQDTNISITKQMAETPVITPDSGEYFNEVEVTINSQTTGSSVKYTTNGEDPLTSSSAKTISSFPYKFKVDGNSNGKVRSVAVGEFLETSPESATDYTFKIGPLSFSIAEPKNLVKIENEIVKSTTLNAKVYYSKDSNVDEASDLQVPITGLSVDGTASYYFKAFKTDYTNDSLSSYRIYSVASSTYKVLTPTNCDLNSAPLICILSFSQGQEDALFEINIIPPTQATISFVRFYTAGTDPLVVEPTEINQGVYSFKIPNPSLLNLGNGYFGIVEVTYNDSVTTGKLFNLKANFPPTIYLFNLNPDSSQYSPKIKFITTVGDTGKISSIKLQRKQEGDIDYSTINIYPVDADYVTGFTLEDDSLDIGGDYLYRIEVADALGATMGSSDLKFTHYQKGDVNKDFKLDIPNDFMIILRAIFDDRLAILEAMDMDENSKINVFDLLNFLKKFFN